MPAKIFTIIEGHDSSSGEDWVKRDEAYRDDDLKNIKDPVNFTKPITSIPSPFARLTLVNDAFKFVNDSFEKDLQKEGRTEYHRIVAEWLDIAEIFFRYSIFKDDPNLKIIKIPFTADTLKSKYQVSSSLIDSFLLEIELEEKIWKDFSYFTVIRYNEVVMGSTSPYSLFCSSDYRGRTHNADKGILKFSENYQFFDEKFEPLYLRNKDFILFMISYFKQNEIEFTEILPSIKSYIDKNREYVLRKNIISQVEYSSANSVDKSPYKKLVPEEFNSPLSIGKFIIYCLDPTKNNEVSKSSFLIESRKKFDGDKTPLALPNRLSTKHIQKNIYIGEESWPDEQFAPYDDSTSNIYNRRLPFRNFITHPYLTISDILEPSLIRLNYQVSDKFILPESFKNFQDKKDDNKKFTFLLPIKRKFFEFFTMEDFDYLIKHNLKIEEVGQNSNHYKVIIIIPLKDGGSIEFKRDYIINKAPRISESENQGTLISFDGFAMSVFPFIKYDPNIYKGITFPINIFYRAKNKTEINLWKAEDKVEQVNRIAKEISEVEKDFFSIDNNSVRQFTAVHFENTVYDLISIDITSAREYGVGGTASALILPLLNENDNNRQFSFGIDFGTTNTHIEYSVDDGEVEPFKYNSPLAVSLHERNQINAETNFFDRIEGIAFMPILLSEVSSIPSIDLNNFPQRSVLASVRTPLSTNIEFIPPIHYNIPFSYLKREIGFLNTKTNLKWPRSEAEKKLIRIFLENLMILIQAKVLSEGGNPKSTNIIYTYTRSMKGSVKNIIENSWKSLFAKYFQDDKSRLKTIDESMAPYYFYKYERGNMDDSLNISIDIGGGTTDIVIYEHKNPKLISSFKFAANSIFGNGYIDNLQENGFYSQYYESTKQALSSLPQLQNALSELKETNKPEDIVAFLFSLPENPQFKEKHISLDFSNTLSEKFGFVFFVFYTSIIYHIAQIFKKHNYDIPKNLLFSGLGSRVINRISQDDEMLKSVTKKIFESILEKKVSASSQFEIRTNPKPKEITAKGALKSFNEKIDKDVKSFTLFISPDLNTESLKFEDLNDEIFKKTIDEVEKFFALIEGILKTNKDLFTALDLSNDKLKNNFKFLQRGNEILYTYLRNGIENRKKEGEGDQKSEELPETLFFYPLVGSLFMLSSELGKNK